MNALGGSLSSSLATTSAPGSVEVKCWINGIPIEACVEWVRYLSALALDPKVSQCMTIVSQVTIFPVRFLLKGSTSSNEG